MSNESNGTDRISEELAAWRRLLREPGALPGQGLADKDAAWDRLFERLNTKPRRRIFGYRIAAACILISLIPATRFFRRPDPGQGRVAAEKVRPAPVSPAANRPGGIGHQTADRPGTPSTQPRTAEARPGIGQEPQSRYNRPAVTRRIRVHPASIHGDTVRTGIAPAELRAAPPPVTTPPPLILAAVPPPAHPAAAKQKKVWKVVDINELEPGTTRPPRMVADRQPRPLHIEINLTTQNR